ncbi:MAG: amino acid ABC transporter ATP-binding protein [Cocleimonas sp.]|nr:amino acid ABC transporter ATP-binding protein [Sulfurovaceae bacterium]MCK5917886.1 amino acid ABC transporter ATP-binding protein [Cocleimonas sp.]
MLDIIDLHKNFGSLEVLKGVSLSASKGDVISILGRSGSGKSTFLRCINFLETPTSGTITLNNCSISISSTNPQKPSKKQILQLRTQTAMVFQQFNLWSHMTVLKNISITLTSVLKLDKKAAKQRALAYLEQVGVRDKQDHYPEQLSGGQQQRVSIARALAMEPEILLFDEPTSALDPELVEEVLMVMQDLAKQGKTMLVVTHEMNFAREVANRVVFFNDGLIVEDGKPEDVFTQPKSEEFKRFISKKY